MRFKLLFSIFAVSAVSFATGCASNQTHTEDGVAQARVYALEDGGLDNIPTEELTAQPGLVAGESAKQNGYAAYAERISVSDASGAKHSLLKRVHFDYNKVFLPFQYRKEVFKHAEFMQQQPEIKVILQGSADIGGKKHAHNKIGFMRSETVKAWLVKYGVAPERISIGTFGSDQPIAEGDSKEAWAENRRVDFVYYF